MTAQRLAASLCVVALVAPGVAVEAQDAPLHAELSADSVGVAEIFDLVVHVDVPPGSAVYFPDTVATSPTVESHGRVEWRAERSGASATVTLRYPLIPFGTGTLQVPGVDVIVAPVASAEGDEGEDIPGGSLVGAWADAPGASSAIRRHLSEELRVWVAPVQTDEELASGAMPRPPDDVMGFGWSWPNVILIGLFSSALAAAGATATKEWVGRRRSAAPVAGAPTVTPDAARRAALAKIERLLAGAPYAQDRQPSVYKASSDVIRRYVERLDRAWGPGLTSTELMDRFGGVDPASSTLARELGTAERVKFGRHRAESDGVQSHLDALRAWLSDSREDARS